MTRWALPAAFILCFAACEGSEIAVFSAASAGSSGAAGGSGLPDTTSAGMTGITAGASLGGSSGDGADAVALGGNGGTVDPVCQRTEDCDANYFCSKRNCGDAQGSCVLRPFPDETLSAYVCGCDHVTYWNDSLRQWYGVPASTTGICNQGRGICTRREDCNVNGVMDAACAHLLPPGATCSSPPGQGQCWVVPRDCSADKALTYQICPSPDGSGGGVAECGSTCQAIQSGRPFTLPIDQSCP